MRALLKGLMVSKLCISDQLKCLTYSECATNTATTLKLFKPRWRWNTLAMNYWKGCRMPKLLSIVWKQQSKPHLLNCALPCQHQLQNKLHLSLPILTIWGRRNIIRERKERDHRLFYETLRRPCVKNSFTNLLINQSVCTDPTIECQYSWWDMFTFVHV